jgi:hypothetical protein
MHIGYLWESQKEIDHWEDQDVGEWTILKWIFNEPSGSTKFWKVLEWLHNWQLLKKGSAP